MIRRGTRNSVLGLELVLLFFAVGAAGCADRKRISKLEEDIKVLQHKKAELILQQKTANTYSAETIAKFVLPCIGKSNAAVRDLIYCSCILDALEPTVPESEILRIENNRTETVRQTFIQAENECRAKAEDWQKKVR
jgi:hypothetical protein